MRANHGTLLGGLLFSCNPYDGESPITIGTVDGNPIDQPLDIEDAEEIIKIMRSFIRKIKARNGGRGA
jgi:hypothetical protein